MPQYTTSQEAMAAGASRVHDAATAIQTHLQRLRAEVDTMMGGWRGEAASAFRHVHDAFESNAEKINASLRDMHETLLVTHRIYAQQESAETRTLTGIAGRMTG